MTSTHDGICGCGCGRPTEIATETRPRRGWRLGQPKPFLSHHSKYRNYSRDGITKQCSYCRKQRPLDDFYHQKESPDSRQPNCKECSYKKLKEYKATDRGNDRIALARMRFKLAQYGLTQESYEALFDAQKGVCAICARPETATWRGTVRNLAVDHDHITGRVRGLLCIACNQGIGHLRDDPALLENAASYLRRADLG